MTQEIIVFQTFDTTIWPLSALNKRNKSRTKENSIISACDLALKVLSAGGANSTSERAAGHFPSIWSDRYFNSNIIPGMPEFSKMHYKKARKAFKIYVFDVNMERKYLGSRFYGFALLENQHYWPANREKKAFCSKLLPYKYSVRQ